VEKKIKNSILSFFILFFLGFFSGVIFTGVISDISTRPSRLLLEQYTAERTTAATEIRNLESSLQTAREFNTELRGTVEDIRAISEDLGRVSTSTISDIREAISTVREIRTQVEILQDRILYFDRSVSNFNNSTDSDSPI
jgi:hypothetical protein